MQEMSSFLSLDTSTELVVDRSKQHELLRVNFNVRCTQRSVQHKVTRLTLA
jgi:hypothetical protein